MAKKISFAITSHCKYSSYTSLNIRTGAVVLGMLISWAIVGCTEGKDIPTLPDSQPIAISTGNTITFTSSTLSRDDSEDPESKTPVLPETVGVFASMEDFDGKIFDNQKFIRRVPYSETYELNKLSLQTEWGVTNDTTDWHVDWPYAPIQYWTPGKNYDFFCYGPHSSYQDVTVELSRNLYGQMSIFTIKNIPPYSAMDYIAANSVVRHNKMGRVDFVGMVHLSARLCMRMKIGEQYSKLRDIRITKITVNDKNNNANYFQCDITGSNIEIKETAVHYNPTADSEINIIRIFEDADGLKLEPDMYQQFGSLYVMPQIVPYITINVTYDVYDKKGKKIREKQQVTNEIKINMTDQLERGNYYNVNIVVSPKYLYVLSDNDVAPDGILDIKDTDD